MSHEQTSAPVPRTGDEKEQTRRAFDAAKPVYNLAYQGLRGIRRIRSITSRRSWVSGGCDRLSRICI